MNDETNSTFWDEIQIEELEELLRDLGTARPTALHSQVRTLLDASGEESVTWAAYDGQIALRDAAPSASFKVTCSVYGEWSLEIFEGDTAFDIDIPRYYTEKPPLESVMYAWDMFCIVAGVA